MRQFITATLMVLMPLPLFAQNIFQNLGVQATDIPIAGLTYSIRSNTVSAGGYVEDPENTVYRIDLTGETQAEQIGLVYRHGWRHSERLWSEVYGGLSYTGVTTSLTGSVDQETMTTGMSVSGFSDARLGFRTSLRISSDAVVTYGLYGGYSVQTNLVVSGEDYWGQELYLTHQRPNSPVGMYAGYTRHVQDNFFFGENPEETMLLGAVYDPDGPWSFHLRREQSDNLIVNSQTVTTGIGYQVSDKVNLGLSISHESLKLMSFDAGETVQVSASVAYSF